LQLTSELDGKLGVTACANIAILKKKVVAKPLETTLSLAL